MSRVMLVSYNIGGSFDALKAICKYISRKQNVICAIQEFYGKETRNDNRRKLKSYSSYYIKSQILAITNRKIKFVNKFSDRSVFITTNDIKVVPNKTIDPFQRYNSISLGSKSFGMINIIGLHGYDLRNHPIGTDDRTSKDTRLADSINAFACMTPTVIMGDFNCPPYYPLLSGNLGLFARRDKSEVIQLARKSLSRPIYYNPFWNLLVENAQGANGTFFFNNYENPVRWPILDQIVVSHQLADRISDYDILESSPQIKFYSKGSINPQYSDHLPVHAFLDLK